MKALQAGLIALLAAVPAAADVSVVGAADVHATLVSNPKAVVVDARTPAEYEQAHIPGAINIPAGEMRTSARGCRAIARRRSSSTAAASVEG